MESRQLVKLVFRRNFFLRMHVQVYHANVLTRCMKSSVVSMEWKYELLTVSVKNRPNRKPPLLVESLFGRMGGVVMHVRSKTSVKWLF